MGDQMLLRLRRSTTIYWHSDKESEPVDLFSVRLTAAMFVAVHLLLRGAAVPHSHGTDNSCTPQASGVHVHLNWLSEDRGQPCDHRLGDANCDACQSPDHGGVVYLDDVMVFDPAQEKAGSANAGVNGDEASRVDGFVILRLTLPIPGAARPVGDIADTLHRLLPHVLRV